MNFADAMMILNKHEPETAKRIRETLAELEKENIFANTDGYEALYRGHLKSTIAL